MIVRLDTSVETTNNFVPWDDVDYYEEGGFKLDFTLQHAAPVDSRLTLGTTTSPETTSSGSLLST